MSNNYYSHGSFPSTGSAATSASMRAELDLVTAGFDKLPTLTSNANKFVLVNSTSTGLTATSSLPTSTATDTSFTVQNATDNTKTFQFLASAITAGTLRVYTMPDASTTLVGTTATQTLTNKTLTAPIFSTIVNTGVLTLPTSTDTLVGRATTDTLTNKTLTAPIFSTIVNTGVLTLPTSTDTLVGRATTDTLTNKTLGAVTLSGTVSGGGNQINNVIIGSTTPLAGAFTTLSASSTVSGTGFSTYLASPPAIGGTAAAAGAFTTLSASSTVSGTGFSTYLASPPAIGGTAAAAGTFTAIVGTSVTNSALTATRLVYSGTAGLEVDSANLTFNGTILTSTGFAGPLNGTVGATTANTGAFTTLTTSSTVTLNGGTANGVAYLNGSKVLTTGSALTFDGTAALTITGAGSSGNGAGPAFGVSSNSTADQYYMRLNSAKQLTFYGYDQSNSANGWSSLALADGGKWVFYAANAEAMILNSSGLEVKQSQLIGYSSYAGIGTNGLAVAGNVGIGTSSPIAKLTVVGPMWVPASPFKSVVDLYSTDAQAADIGAGITLGGVYDSSNNRTTFAQIAGIKENSTSGNFAGALALYTRVNGAGLVERARLDSSGNLGLGVTPSAWGSTYKAFQVGNGGSIFGRTNVARQVGLSANIYNNGSGNLYIASEAASQYQQDAGAHYWYRSTSAQVAETDPVFEQAMTLDASGNLLVGATATAYGERLNVVTSGAAATGGYFLYNSTDDRRVLILQHVRATGATSATMMAFLDASSAVVGSITANGTATLYNTTSDYRLKTVVGPVTDAGQRIDALEPVEYTWNSNGERTRGFLAHQFQEVYAGSVTGTKDAVDAEGKPVYQAMQAGSSEVIADLVAEIQDLRKRLATLEAK